MIEIAHSLHLDVVAEGVESHSVWRRLAQLGCDLAQGFAIARPMALDDLRRWIADRPATTVPVEQPLSIHSLQPAVAAS